MEKLMELLDNIIQVMIDFLESNRVERYKPEELDRWLNNAREKLKIQL